MFETVFYDLSTKLVCCICYYLYQKLIIHLLCLHIITPSSPLTWPVSVSHAPSLQEFQDYTHLDLKKRQCFRASSTHFSINVKRTFFLVHFNRSNSRKFSCFLDIGSLCTYSKTHQIFWKF